MTTYELLPETECTSNTLKGTKDTIEPFETLLYYNIFYHGILDYVIMRSSIV